METKLLVGKDTLPHSLKTSIIGFLKDSVDKVVYLDCIGVAANYVATKAIIMAQGELSMSGEVLISNPIYKDFEIKDPKNSKIKTGIRWRIKKSK